MIARATHLTRMRCICGHDDRICAHCGAPFEAERPCQSTPGVLAHCPRCGAPHHGTRASAVEVAKARAERGLIR